MTESKHQQHENEKLKVKGQETDAPAQHGRSHAAHLKDKAKPHTKPEGNLRQGSAPGARRQP